MRKLNLSLLLLVAALVVGGFFVAANRIQAAPVQQDAVDAADTTVFLPIVSSQSGVVTTAAPLLPEQYDADSESEPVIADDLIQASTCWSYIKFSNSSSYSIQIYWVNSYGSEVLYKTLSSRSSYWQQTYWGHSWRVRTTSGTLLKSLTTYTCFTTYVSIDNNDFPQPTATPTKTPTPAPTATPTSPGGACYTQIIATHSNKCMKVKDSSTQSGAQIVQYSCDSNSNQLFSFSLVAGTTDTYVITAKQSGKVLDVKDGSTQSGKWVIQYGANGSSSQKWQVIPVSGNVYELKNVKSGLVADVEGGTSSTSNGAAVIQWGDANAANQRWQIASCIQPPVPPTATPTATPVAQLGSIGDRVWNDTNRNGIQDGGEVGVANVPLQLTSCGGAVLQNTTTNGNGNYSFNNLPAACYLVGITVPGGFQLSPKAQGTDGNLDSDINIGNALSDGINLGTGQNLTNIDAGINQPSAPTATPTNTAVPQLGSIGDRVWNDFNRNGIQDSGEPGIANVAVQLRSCGGAILQNTNTDGNGIYRFNGLAAGCYVVRFIDINANTFAFSPGNQGGNDNLDSDVTSLDSVTPGIVNGQTDQINLGAGQNIDNVDAGLNQPVGPTATPTATPVPQLGSIGDRVWNDTNGNGVQDGGELGVSGVTVQLKDCSGNLLQTTTTDGSGIYTFGNLAAGCYTVSVVLPGGFTFSPVNIGDDNTDSDVNPANGVTGNINLGAGQTVTNVDAGLVPQPANTGSIGDKVWKDINSNGVQDPGEPGVPGVTVTLRTCAGDEQATTTDANGNYSFSGLAAGCYTVIVTLPNGYTFSPQDQGGDDNADSDVNPGNGTTATVILNTGQNRTDVDAGLIPQSGGEICLGDRVWRDSNVNGLQDPGEPDFANVEIYLGVDTNDDGRIDGYRGSTTTNASGLYQFCGLDPSTPYLIEVVPPGFCGFTLPNVGSDDTIDSDANISKGIMGPIIVNQIDNSYDAGIVCHE